MFSPSFNVFNFIDSGVRVTAGIIMYVSSAYLQSEFPGVAAFRSAASTTYKASLLLDLGPMYATERQTSNTRHRLMPLP